MQVGALSSGERERISQAVQRTSTATLAQGREGAAIRRFCGYPDRSGRSSVGGGCVVVAPVMASERDLRTLAAIVSEDRADLPANGGLPESLLSDLMSQIRCDVISFERFDSQREKTRFLQSIPDPDRAWLEEMDPLHWQHYWDCRPCSYPDRTADLRSVVKIADFYTARQWHHTGMYCDRFRSVGFEHNLMLTLPAAPGPVQGPGQTMRLFFFRGPGPDFSERDRAVLTLLRPHLRQPTWTPSGAAIPFPGLPAGSRTCCAWSRPGTPIPRSPDGSASPRGRCGPTWKISTRS